MGHVVIDVMLKPEILDPQGQAVAGALPRVGFDQFTEVRQGKRFVLSVDGPVGPAELAAARSAAERLLTNPVIEDIVSVRALDGADRRRETSSEPSTADDPAQHDSGQHEATQAGA